jgi:hypothetical protein
MRTSSRTVRSAVTGLFVVACGGGSAETSGPNGADDTLPEADGGGSTSSTDAAVAALDAGSPRTDSGAARDAGGVGSCSGTAVVIRPSTQTTTIPANATSCSGATYGSKGDLVATTVPVCEGSTRVTALTLRYDMNAYFGEPTRKAVVAWEGSGGLSGVQWLAEVQSSQGRQYVTASGKRVFASYLVGSIKGPGQGFGTDSTGSPSWSQTFVVYDPATGVADGVPEAEAKNIYKACFKLANLGLVKLNGKPALR